MIAESVVAMAFPADAAAARGGFPQLLHGGLNGLGLSGGVYIAKIHNEDLLVVIFQKMNLLYL